MKKKVATFILAACVLLGTLADDESAPHTNTVVVVNGATWQYRKLSDTEVELTWLDRDAERPDDLLIPQTIDGCTVVSLDKNLLVGCRFSSIVVPEGVRRIGTNALYGTWADRIDLPSSLEEIGNFALNGILVDSLYLGPHLRSIGAAAFMNKNGGRTEILLDPANPYLKQIGTAIYTADGKTLLSGDMYGDSRVADGTESVQNYAFYYHGVTSISIPASVTNLPQYAFMAMPYLETIELRDGAFLTSLAAMEMFVRFDGDLAALKITQDITDISPEVANLTGLRCFFADAGDEKRVEALLRSRGVDTDRIPVLNLLPYAIPTNRIPQTAAFERQGRYGKKQEPFSCAASLPTGKRSASGKYLQLWDDWVAGTNPLNTNEIFRVRISITNRVPVITWSPRLTVDEAAKRTYTILGCTDLATGAWQPVDGDTGAYRFFKVTVERNVE